MRRSSSMIKAAISGQAMIETLFIIVIFTAAFFAAVQLCIIAVNDLIVNEAAFSALRVAVVAPAPQCCDKAKNAADMLLLPQYLKTRSNLIQHETTLWNNTIQGNPVTDHSSREIMKYNTNISYSTRIMFSSLINPFVNSGFLTGGKGFVRQTARSRLVKSPDEEYYFRAYPGARCFTRTNESE